MSPPAGSAENRSCIANGSARSPPIQVHPRGAASQRSHLFLPMRLPGQERAAVFLDGSLRVQTREHVDLLLVFEAGALERCMDEEAPIGSS